LDGKLYAKRTLDTILWTACASLKEGTRNRIVALLPLDSEEGTTVVALGK
jgi:hypothetical protein